MLDTILIALILLVDAGILYVEWSVAQYQRKYWESRAAWYAARGKRNPSPDADVPATLTEGAENVEGKS